MAYINYYYCSTTANTRAHVSQMRITKIRFRRRTILCDAWNGTVRDAKQAVNRYALLNEWTAQKSFCWESVVCSKGRTIVTIVDGETLHLWSVTFVNSINRSTTFSWTGGAKWSPPLIITPSNLYCTLCTHARINSFNWMVAWSFQLIGAKRHWAMLTEWQKIRVVSI